MKRILNLILPVTLICMMIAGSIFISACDDDDEENTEQSTAGESPPAAEETEIIPTYTIADPTGDWGYPSPYLRYSRGPGYIRSSFVFDNLIWKDETGFRISDR